MAHDEPQLGKRMKAKTKAPVRLFRELWEPLTTSAAMAQATRRTHSCGCKRDKTSTAIIDGCMVGLCSERRDIEVSRWVSVGGSRSSGQRSENASPYGVRIRDASLGSSDWTQLRAAFTHALSVIGSSTR